MRRLTPYALRAVALCALVLLLWNPTVTQDAPDTGPPLVLLDASLSMTAPGVWPAALDSARRAALGGVAWRFGTDVAAFDTTAPDAGASRLGPALTAAAARTGPIVVVTDGELDDVAGIPADVRARARVVHVPRTPRRDVFVARVDAPRRVALTDTVRFRVAYGVAGPRNDASPATVRLAVSRAGRVLAARTVPLPDSGVMTAALGIAARALGPPGTAVLDVRLLDAADAEPRDDGRLVLLELSPEPAAVILADPPTWDTRFLAKALDDVARVPVRTFVRVGGEGGRAWRDGRTLRPVSAAEVGRALRHARLVVRTGTGAAAGSLPASAATLILTSDDVAVGEWYVRPGPGAPFAAALAGIEWDALPPATGVAGWVPPAGGTVALEATLARRGAPRPALVLHRRGGTRHAVLAAAGLWRWQFRGGASAVAYRALLAALVSWLLADGGDAGAARIVADPAVVPNGLPIEWRWVGAGAPRDVPLALSSADTTRVDTLRFTPAGRAAVRLAPGVYAYRVPGAPDRGTVAVEDYSDEWRPRPVVLSTQPGVGGGGTVAVGLRGWWWLYVVVVAALVAEWGWRRRQGLP